MWRKKDGKNLLCRFTPTCVHRQMHQLGKPPANPRGMRCNVSKGAWSAMILKESSALSDPRVLHPRGSISQVPRVLSRRLQHRRATMAGGQGRRPHGHPSLASSSRIRVVPIPATGWAALHTNSVIPQCSRFMLANFLYYALEAKITSDAH